MSDAFRAALVQGIREWGLPCDHDQIESFALYHRLVLEKNKEVNLTAITGELDSAVKHFMDSLSVLRYIKPEEKAAVIDVGTGAGFPGMVLKIACPAIRLTLLDSSRKKVAFLQDAIKRLGIAGAEAVWGRAEEIARDAKRRETYDWVLSRGVAEIRVLAEYCLPLAAVGGLFVAYKGPGAETELADAAHAISTLGGRVTAVHSLDLPLEGGARNLILVSKVGSTPAQYPRRPGIPEKRPL